MIPVTKPFLPPREEYEQYLAGIWQSGWLTNMGPLANKLELELKVYLTVKNLLFVTSGTMALQIAIKALKLSGEIITTPFSFAATTSSIVWEGCRPVFVDIDPNSLNIDPDKIEAAITENTSAILATHIYGNPCDVEAIDKIAKKYYLKVIYDGAQAFGVDLNGKSIFQYGDISICSLHATKYFHTGEGGLVFTKNPGLLKKMACMRNFGFKNTEDFAELGINGKNSEFHAALGLANLKYITEVHKKRRQLTEYYYYMLKGDNVFIPEWHKDATMNYAFLPIVFVSEDMAMACFHALEKKKIFARRYFYPPLNSGLPYLPTENMPVTDDIAKRVLCLPLYYDLSLAEVDMICRLILTVQNNFKMKPLELQE